MKKLVLVALVALAIAIPATSQARLDIGIDIPKGLGTVLPSDMSAEIDSSTMDALNGIFLPLPEAAIHYQIGLGPVNVGLGARAFTWILVSAVYPNVFAELELGPVAIEAQMGGGIFGWYAVATGGIETGKVFFPDISAWYAFGEKRIFRLGVGAIGVLLPDQNLDYIPFMFYFGGKASIML